MNQWETETVQIGLALFAVLFIVFLFTPKRWARSVFLPKTFLSLNFAWLTSALVYSSAGKLSFLKGLPFLIAYSFIIVSSPVLIAGGMLEAVFYSMFAIKTGFPTLALRKHTHAFLFAVFSLCAYFVARYLTAGNS